MVARHVTLRLRPGGLAAAHRIFAGDALPLLRQQQGFVAACLCGDEAEGLGVIAIFWRQAADSQRLEANGFYRAQIAKFLPVLHEPPKAALLHVEVVTFIPPS